MGIGRDGVAGGALETVVEDAGEGESEGGEVTSGARSERDDERRSEGGMFGGGRKLDVTRFAALCACVVVGERGARTVAAGAVQRAVVTPAGVGASARGR
jgi:hypothetical protein